MKKAFYTLPIIIFAQFCGTSLWFSGNAVITDLISSYNLPSSALTHLTTVVQLGFIIGTLLFALLSIADRFSPSKVFLASALIGSLCNLAIIWSQNTFYSLLLIRLLTGFFLAGIYPVGMKIAADYYDKGLSKSLGFLVGALVLGTAYPHLISTFTDSIPWKNVVVVTSVTAFIGGLVLYLLVPDGPYRKKGYTMRLRELRYIFRNRSFSRAALGYFGHMWELYAFWMLVPLLLATYQASWPASEFSVSLYSFIVIGAGSISCIASGYISERLGVQKTGRLFLFLSAVCCIISPLFFMIDTPLGLLGVLCFWGLVVIADSPLFSTLVAQNAVPELKGTAITLVTCIGFAISIVSIQAVLFLQAYVPVRWLLPILALGPIGGIIFTKKNPLRIP